MWRKKKATAALGYFNMELLRVTKKNQEKKMGKKGSLRYETQESMESWTLIEESVSR